MRTYWVDGLSAAVWTLADWVVGRVEREVNGVGRRVKWRKVLGGGANGLGRVGRTRAHRSGRRGRGVTLIELIAVAVVLGVLALIITPDVTNGIGMGKTASFATTLGTLQSASDNFYARTGAYPTYSGATVAYQPGACPDAFELNTAAQDQSGKAFISGYVRSAPPATAATVGLNQAAGATVYYGVASGGIAFATQAAPEVAGGGSGTPNEWDLAGTPIYTQQLDGGPAGTSPIGAFTTLGAACAGYTTTSSGITASAALSGSTLTVSGTAPANSPVTVTVTDPQEQTVTATSTGAYTVTFNLAATGITNLITVSAVESGTDHIAGAVITSAGTVLDSNGTTATAQSTPPPPATYIITAVTASTWDNEPTWVPQNAFDGNLSTEWASSDGTQWIEGELNQAGPIGSISIAPQPGDSNDIMAATLYGSNDGSTWIPLQSWSGVPVGADQNKSLITLTLPEPSANYLYIKFQGSFSTVDYAAGDWFDFWEIQVHSAT